MTTFLDYTREAYFSLEKAWAASENKLIIIRAISQKMKDNIDAAPDEATKEFWRHRKYRWDDLRTRARWASRFMGRNISKMRYDQHIQGICNKIYMMAGGKVLPDFKFKRLSSPLSFTVEPCQLCKSLQQSFSPNDKKLRSETSPWDDQFYEILIALAHDAYKVMGTGLYYREKIRELEPTLTGNSPGGYPWSEVIQMWDVMLEHSRQFLFHGRACFATTELVMQKQEDNIQGSRLEGRQFGLNRKYFNEPDDTFKCVTGLYAINRELLCATCKQAVEPEIFSRG